MPDSEQSPLTHLKLSVDTSSIVPAISAAVAEVWLLYGVLLPDDDIKALLRDCTVPRLPCPAESAGAHVLFTFDRERFSRQCAELARLRQGATLFARAGGLKSACSEFASDAEKRALPKVQVGPLDV